MSSLALTHTTPETPILDIEAFHEAKKVMGAKFPTMIEYFLNDTADYLTHIESALQKGSAQDMVPPAHTAKSSSRQMGALRLSELAKSIEQTACTAINAQGSLDAVPALLAEMKQAYALTHDAFTKQA